LGTSTRSVVGQGQIVLVDENNQPAPMPADPLAVTLRGRGVQLVVLRTCQTGRRDEQNVWSGVVVALMEAGIPATVAMQHPLWDDSAIAFSRRLHQALLADLPLDQAVAWEWCAEPPPGAGHGCRTSASIWCWPFGAPLHRFCH